MVGQFQQCRRFFVALTLCTCTGFVFAEEPEWQSEDKSALITQCFEEAQERMVPALTERIGDALPEPAMQALLVANSQELAANCQCLFSRLTNTYTPRDFASRPEVVLADANALSDEGGACASNVEAIMERTRQRLQDQLAGMTSGGASHE